MFTSTAISARLRRLSAVGLASAALTLAAAGPGWASAAPTADHSPEQVAAIAESGIVFIDISWQGYVGVPTSTGTEWSKVKASAFCSGFVVDNSGYVVTAGHCADPAMGRIDLIDQLLDDAVRDGSITSAKAAALQSTAERDWRTEGASPGEPISRLVKVYQRSATSGLQGSQGLIANVVENRPVEQGDLTLLKVQTPVPMPALRVADDGPQVGDHIAVLGYAGTVLDSVDVENLQPSFKTGSVSSKQTQNGSPFLEFDAAATHGMSGGPVVDMKGDVVGVVSQGTGDSQQFNLAVGFETVQAMLTRNGVRSAVSGPDQAFRDGLDAYFGGDFATAVGAFDRVLGTEPGNVQAQVYRAKAVAQGGSSSSVGASGSAGATVSGSARTAAVGLAADQAAQSGNTLLVMLLAGGLLLVLAIGAVLVLVARSRARTRRPQPAVTTGPMPAFVPAAGLTDWPTQQMWPRPAADPYSQPRAYSRV